MRLSTLAGIGIAVIAVAALAQTTRTGPDRKDTPAASSAPANDQSANTAMAADPPAGNTTIAPPGGKTEPATPPR